MRETRTQLAGAVADDFVQGRHQVLGLVAVSLDDANLFGRGGELFERRRARRAREGARRACEEEVLRAVLLVNLVLVRKVVADRVDVEVAGLGQRLDGHRDGRADALLLVLVLPGRAVLEVLSVVRDLRHQLVELLVRDRDEALNRALDAARVSVDLDEAVREVNGHAVLHPGLADRNPVRVLARLVVAYELVNHLRLTGFGVGSRLLKIADGLLQIFGVEAGRD